MKKILILMAVLCTVLSSQAQDFDAPINRDWQRYATDTSLTYREITYICDSPPVVPDVPKGIRNE
jgi:hypothetical protein